MKKLLFILPLLTVLCVHAQENNKIRAMATALDSLRSKAPVEKVHIQFDKPFYVLGDTLWMKAYVTDEQGRLSGLSNILQADLVDDRGVVKASLHLPLTEGLGWGSIALTDSLLSEGNYHLRAYTTLMRNYDNAYFFDKEISIGNTMSLNTTSTVYASTGSAVAIIASAASKPQTDTAVRVQFFPEGGNMVDGLPSVVAFKALGPDGLGRNIAGYITDKNNQQVADFHSEHAGMGTFVLIPETGNVYTAVIKFADSSQRRFALPSALPQGYVLSVSQNADKVFVRVLTSNSLLKTGTVTLVAQAGNAISYSGSVTPNNPRMTAIIPKNGLPGGIVQLTLFSPQFEPLAERLVFIRKNDDRLTIKVTPDKPSYKQRDKVHLGLEVTDSQGKPVSGAFSLAITGEGKVPYSEVNEKTIFSDLLLSGDLKGYIEHPNYYFTDTSAVKAAELDNLLLTQGWRRFVWKDILNNSLPAPAYASANSMGISGQVLTSKGKPAAGAKVYVLLNTKGGKVINTEADTQGKFRFDRIVLPKGLTYIVSATDAKGKKKVTVNVDKAKEATPPAWQAVPDDGPEHESLLTYIDSARKQNIAVRNSTPEYRANANMTNKNIALKEVEIREKKKDEIQKIALQDSKNPVRNPDFDDNIFTFVDLDKAGAVGTFLAANAPGLRIEVTRGWIPYWEGQIVPVIVNGRREGPGEYSTILPDQIAAIEIIKGFKAGNAGASMANASINITLKSPVVNYQKYIDENDDDQTEADAKKAVAKEEKKKKVIELKEVDIREKKQSEFLKIALKNSKNIAGPADHVLTFLDMQHCNTLGGCLVGRLGDIRVTPKPNGGFTTSFEAGQLLVVLDGRKLSVEEANELLPTITPDQIAAIEVKKGITVYGPIETHNPKNPPPPTTGVIVITTKSGEDYQKYIDEDEDDQTESSAKAYAAKHETKNTPVIRDAALAGSKNLAGPGHANTVLTFADLAGCGSVLKGCLVGNLPGVKLKDRPLGGWEPSFKGALMKVYVDGAETGASTYSNLVPATIAAVEAVDSGDPATLYHGPALLISLKKTDVDYDAYLEQHKKENNSNIQLKEIEIKAKKLGVSIQDMAVKHSQNLAGAGHADQVLTFVDLLGCQADLSECLQGRLTNIVFQDVNGKLAPYSRGFDKPMLVVVDGIPGRSLDDVMSSDVASVEVLRGGGAAALYGMNGANGVMIITTKQGDVDYDAFTGNFRSVSEKPRVIKTYTFTGGYDLRREFYSPDYDNPGTNQQLADLRTTIYWAPNIITDKDGKASLQFFNSDDTGGYRIITEGLDGQGKLGRQVGRYVVK